MGATTERKREGPERCPSPCESCPDGTHHFGEHFSFKNDPADIDNAEAMGTGPNHPAAQLGVEAWQNCSHCPAWREMFDADVDPSDMDFESYEETGWD
jgi:hypothetical protein